MVVDEKTVDYNKQNNGQQMGGQRDSNASPIQVITDFVEKTPNQAQDN